MATSEPFLCSTDGRNTCVICNLPVDLRKHKKSITFKKDLTTVKGHASKWASLSIPVGDPFFPFTTAYNRTGSINEGYVHNNCVTNLRTKYELSSAKYEKVEDIPVEQPLYISVDTEGQLSTSVPCTRSSLASPTEHIDVKHCCFVCN